jgi:hypothetical protein
MAYNSGKSDQICEPGYLKLRRTGELKITEFPDQNILLLKMVQIQFSLYFHLNDPAGE